MSIEGRNGFPMGEGWFTEENIQRVEGKLRKYFQMPTYLELCEQEQEALQQKITEENNPEAFALFDRVEAEISPYIKNTAACIALIRKALREVAQQVPPDQEQTVRRMLLISKGLFHTQ